MPPPSERRRSNRFRPRLEALELRDVPAICHWTGAVSSAFDNPANWFGGVPQAGDNIVFEPYLEPAPPLEEPPPPPTYVSHPCTGMTGATGGDGSGVYNAVTLLGSYTSTVTLASGFTTRAFILEGGTINQPATAAGTDITVIGGFYGPLNGAFYWTGGTLNGTANLATVTITGSGTTGLIAPTSGGTVELGSHIDIKNGAVVTGKEGTIELLNDGIELNIHENCTFLVDPGQNKVIQFIPNDPQLVLFGNPTNILEGGVLHGLSGFYNGVNSSCVNEGTFILEPGTKAYFGSQIPSLIPTMPGNTSFKTSGVEYIAADATLEVHFEMRKIAGAIVVKSGQKPQGFSGNVVGDLNIQNGDVYIENMGGDSRQFGVFMVAGDVTWTGGTFRPFVSDSFDGEGWSDDWYVTGTFTIGGSAAVVATAVDGENNESSPNPNLQWFLFTALGGITAANNTPSLNAGWVFVKGPNNPNVWWNLKGG